MRKAGFFPKMATVNLARNGRFYYPYLLTVIGTAAAFYIAVALAGARDLPVMARYAYLSAFMGIGVFVIALFAVIFLTYTNSFLMKRRRRELGLYNILGLGKRHIALMLGFETLFTAAAGIVGGVALGLLLQKLMTLLLYRIMRFDAYYGFYVSWRGIGWTAVLIGAILFFNLLLNLLRIRVQRPVEMLREGSAGEREPKTRWVSAVLGVLCLGGGYAIAVLTKSATAALGVYFIAVFLVIFGTYFLFSAVSIVILKALRKNKAYYYQTNHFIGVSGMLYRMKRNATGLANICILSTMVLVMVSGTLSLYLGSQGALDAQFPGNVGVGVACGTAEYDPFRADTLSAHIDDALRAEGLSAKPVYSYGWLGLLADGQNGTYEIHAGFKNASCQLCFLTEEAYAAIGGAASGTERDVNLTFPDGRRDTVRAIRLTNRLPAIGGAFASTIKPVWYVVKDQTALNGIDDLQRGAMGESAVGMNWYGFWNVDAPADTLAALPDRLEREISFDNTGSWDRLNVESKENYSRDYYSMNGGFFFLGLFLGTLFLMAAVLIIYYKQVSEGYEDRERYRIMQEVGMEQRTVRRSIDSQIVVVFFAPLLVAAVHIAFDYGLMSRLLTLFSLYDTAMTFWCTLGTFLVFAAIYALVYRATARAYYKIVRTTA